MRGCGMRFAVCATASGEKCFPRPSASRTPHPASSIHSELKPLKLSATERRQIEAFLRTLTAER